MTATAAPSATTDLPVGINIDGVLDHDGLPWPSAAERFARVKHAGVFDYIEKNFDPTEDISAYLGLSEHLQLPLRVMGGIHLAGRDEDRMAREIGIAGQQGAKVFNCQLFARHADGHTLTDQEVADFFLRAMDHGQRSGALPSFEVHVDMWNEDFRRVDAVGDLLARQGVPLRLTLDHSHLIFKIDQAEELAISGIADDVAAGRLALHPADPRAVYALWLAKGWVVHAHTRAVQTSGRPNPWMSRGDGRPGRGIQYPFVQPEPGTYHQPWHEAELTTWKQAVTQLLSWMRAQPERAPAQVSCEFIPFADYGGGARYSVFAQNVACAQWLRGQWAQLA